jgi:hypothetical protein
VNKQSEIVLPVVGEACKQQKREYLVSKMGGGGMEKMVGGS